VDTGRTIMGPVIGDFSKTGIGQLLPTGAVLGVAAMVANGGFCQKSVPSFSWVSPDETTGHDPERALHVARKMMARRSRELTPAEAALFLRLASIASAHETVRA